ncbi:MAG: class I SAM-dependent methyltransferase [Desulfuromonadaceae bacterium]|nr:class I SAM-dependent methyltransferase [Desulfuromonadaceae bacterium]MDD5106894.1 class I SAM-dependent methyltransferase [Desulfuromonadaceae bacterium]
MLKETCHPGQAKASQHLVSGVSQIAPVQHIDPVLPIFAKGNSGGRKMHTFDAVDGASWQRVSADVIDIFLKISNYFKIIAKLILPFVDLFLSPILYPVALLFKLIRIAGVQRLPICRHVLMQVGVFPIRNHYFEPLFDSRVLKYPLEQIRNLPGIDWNVEGQLNLLECFCFNDELKGIPLTKTDKLAFHFNNVSFESGDAEFLYNLIRFKKPARVFEIGSGNSTLMVIKAIERNREENFEYRCRHICIEPYEKPWLEKTGVTVVRQQVENVDKRFFSELEENDILFIDSSHIIRPQGDVLFEYLELLPSLNIGVIVHIHDIFSPWDYPKEWVTNEVRLWNEQYLLEAFLTCNRDWKVLGALSYLHHNYFENLWAKCPYLTRDCVPGSFYMQKIH